MFQLKKMSVKRLPAHQLRQRTGRATLKKKIRRHLFFHYGQHTWMQSKSIQNKQSLELFQITGENDRFRGQISCSMLNISHNLFDSYWFAEKCKHSIRLYEKKRMLRRLIDLLFLLHSCQTHSVDSSRFENGINKEESKWLYSFLHWQFNAEFVHIDCWRKRIIWICCAYFIEHFNLSSLDRSKSSSTSRL